MRWMIITYCYSWCNIEAIRGPGSVIIGGGQFNCSVGGMSWPWVSSCNPPPLPSRHPPSTSLESASMVRPAAVPNVSWTPSKCAPRHYISESGQGDSTHMMSYHGNIFYITGPLWGESEKLQTKVSLGNLPVISEFFSQRASDAELWC